MDTVILQNLSIGYTAKGQNHVVAHGLNAAISSGELTCLLGRNGIGKSTLLRTLSAFQPKLDGSILMRTAKEPGDFGKSVNATMSGDFGKSGNATMSGDSRMSGAEGESALKDLDGFSDKALSRAIGIVLTEKPDVRNMTVEELVGLGRSPYTGFWGTLTEEDRRVVDESIRLVGIEALTRRMVHTLSDGERQKVMIAKALAQQTPVIYLDEPTAFLDYPSKVEVMQLLRRLAAGEGKTVFLSTHDVELALQIADRLWLMEPDALTVGTPAELSAQGALSRFIERDGITFDRTTLQIRVTRHNSP